MRTIVARAPRLAALLLAAVMTLSLLPVSAFAQGDIQVSDEAALIQAVAGDH